MQQKSKFHIKNFKQKMMISVFMLTYAGVLQWLHIGCPILLVTGIRCWGCGMTRALLSVLRLDFAKAFSYHMMFWSVPILYLGFLFDGKILKNKIANLTMWIVLAVGYVGNWLFQVLR